MKKIKFNKIVNNLNNNPLKLNKMKKINKFSKQLILGLSCLGALSVVSCDNNEQTEKITTPTLEKVNFSATVGSGVDIKFSAGDVVTLKMLDSSNPAKYYTTPEIPYSGTGGTEITDLKLTLDANGKVTAIGGNTSKKDFYLESSSSPGKEYKITKFDITEKGKNKASYVLKEEQTVYLVTESTTGFTESIAVLKNEGSVGGDHTPKDGTAGSFKIKDESATEDNTFKVQFRNTSPTILNSIKNGYSDASTKVPEYYSINFKVYEEGKENNPIYSVKDLFEKDEVKAKNFNIFKITLPKKLSEYTNLKISGSYTHGGTYPFGVTNVPSARETVILTGQNS